MELLVATHNKHKFEEIKSIIPSTFKLLSLNDINFNKEIEEPYLTIEENALHKAKTLYALTGMNIIADDTALEIEALYNKPGVFSARFAGENCSYKDNINKVLTLMKDKNNRKAKFRTIIALILNGTEYIFEGKIEGNITKQPRGNMGFGYDPIFEPIGYNKTFAEMSSDEKNKISHRYIALNNLMEFLNNYLQNFNNENI